MGDLFGERQSGVPTFRIADLLGDEERTNGAAWRPPRCSNATRASRNRAAGLRRVLANDTPDR
jgi:RecG-like helicase